MAIGDQIKAARQARGVSQGELGRRINQAQTTVSSWERGRTEPHREDVVRVATALNMDAAELELSAIQARRRRTPVVGYVGAGAEAHFYASGQGELDYVDSPEGGGADTVATEIKGSSLGATFTGWLVFYDDVRSPVTPDLMGRLCVVGLPDDRILVKTLRASQNGRYHLFSETEEPMLDQEITWAARVTGLKPR